MTGSGAAGASYGDLLVTSLVVLVVVAVAAFVVVRVVGRVMATGRARGGHLVEVLARVPLEPRRAVYVLDVAGKTLLVGASEMGMSLLSELDGGAVQARAAEPGGGTSFAELVRAAWQRRRAGRAGGGTDGGDPAGPGGERAGAGAAAAAQTAGGDDTGGGAGAGRS